MAAISVKYAGPNRRNQQRRQCLDRRNVLRIERSTKNRRTESGRRQQKNS